MTGKNENFFKDLDSAKEKKGSCSCITFAILFALIFMLAEAGVFYFFRSIKVKSSDFSASHPSVQNVANISKIDLGENQSQISITQGGLCQKISQIEGNKISNLSCVISSDGITLSGKLSSVLPANSKVTLTPKVDGGALKFEVAKLQIGAINAPKSLANSLSDSINSSLLKVYPELDKVSVQNVELQDGVMLILAKPK